MRTRSSSGSIQLHRVLENLLPEVPAQVLRCTEIDLEPRELAELSMQAKIRRTVFDLPLEVEDERGRLGRREPRFGLFRQPLEWPF